MTRCCRNLAITRFGPRPQFSDQFEVLRIVSLKCKVWVSIGLPIYNQQMKYKVRRPASVSSEQQEIEFRQKIMDLELMILVVYGALDNLCNASTYPYHLRPIGIMVFLRSNEI